MSSSKTCLRRSPGLGLWVGAGRFWEAPEGRRSRLEVVAEQVNVKDVQNLEPMAV